jgi:hypothetical protein
VSPNGDLYGHVSDPPDGRQPILGNMLRDHLGRLAGALPFDATRHAARFGDLMSP